MKISNFKSSPEKISIQIYADGPTLEEIPALKGKVEGYTFNPTLFRKMNVHNYLAHCNRVLEICENTSVSLEVFADDQDSMIRQAKILGALADHVHVKIPITNTHGDFTAPVIEALVAAGLKLNITAVFTINQVRHILPLLRESKTIISVFSGRLFDIGHDAVEVTKAIADLVHEQSDCQVLWASPRMVYDVINAFEANCDIITMQTSLIPKLSLFEKTPEEYSLDTVKMFYKDAQESGYTL